MQYFNVYENIITFEITQVAIDNSYKPVTLLLETVAAQAGWVGVFIL